MLFNSWSLRKKLLKHSTVVKVISERSFALMISYASLKSYPSANTNKHTDLLTHPPSNLVNPFAPTKHAHTHTVCKHPQRHNLMHIYTHTPYRPPETCSSNKDSKSAHINTLPQSVRNTEMVSTCHVNLLSSPSAFHMHYTPGRSVSFSLLLNFCLLHILLSQLHIKYISSLLL